MEWLEMDRVSDQLHRLLHRGAFRGLPEVTVDAAHMMDAELVVRITLADMAHVRDWDVAHPLTPMPDSRRRELAEDGYRLLELVEFVPSQ